MLASAVFSTHIAVYTHTCVYVYEASTYVCMYICLFGNRIVPYYKVRWEKVWKIRECKQWKYQMQIML